MSSILDKEWSVVHSKQIEKYIFLTREEMILNIITQKNTFVLYSGQAIY